MGWHGRARGRGALSRYRLRWLEDVGDPLDFDGLSALAAAYDGPLAAGEALFSAAEARLLAPYGGLRPDRDVLVFDPVHCYGVPGFLSILAELEAAGWPRSAFWPHGGHLFCLHLVAALGLGGAEVNPFAFQPFGGLTDDARVDRAAPRRPSCRASASRAAPRARAAARCIERGQTPLSASRLSVEGGRVLRSRQRRGRRCGGNRARVERPDLP